jgi:heme exporter protein C
MLKHWWKVLTAILLIYVLVMSFIVKLDPGLLDVSETQLSKGQNERVIVGFNTHFAKAKDSNKVFLEQDSLYLCAEVVEIISEQRLRVRIDLPDTLRTTFFNLYVNNDVDGTMNLANAFNTNGVAVSPTAQLPVCTPQVSVTSFQEFGYPFQPVIFESIRNLMFHVPMWFTMFFIMLIAFVSSLRYLSKPSTEMDLRALTAVRVGLLFAVLGLITGSIWARFTWGAWWVSDPQLNGALVTFLIYVGYLVLRAGIEDDQKRARVAAVFNVFAYVILFILLMILPRFAEGLHPGKGGNPGFNSYDLDSSLRAVFYPAVIGWILLGYWIYHLRLRMNRLAMKLYYEEDVE